MTAAKSSEEIAEELFRKEIDPMISSWFLLKENKHRIISAITAALDEAAKGKDVETKKMFSWIQARIPEIKNCQSLGEQIGWMTVEIEKLQSENASLNSYIEKRNAEIAGEIFNMGIEIDVLKSSREKAERVIRAARKWKQFFAFEPPYGSQDPEVEEDIDNELFKAVEAYDKETK